ncbi:glycine--tRNA ligase [Candidatus Saccharibacteria bacterium]|nr:glycine--tRNA ligase [Candidatus Saccharibacteria bacterium]
MSDVSLEDIASLCKRRGFIYQGSEIYGGLAGTWDYGPLGVQLKRNIMNLWWKMFVESRDDMYGVDAAILMNQKVWQASGHVDTFTDPLVECKECKARFREDHIDKSKCPNCGKENTFGEARQFNMMFETYVGPAAMQGLFDAKDILVGTQKKQEAGELDYKSAFLDLQSATERILGSELESRTYLRPETAQGIFTNYKNVVDSFYPDVPFGIAQTGKAFRNEISPRDFVFRSREFEQMEIEYFVHPDQWEAEFEKWRTAVHEWCKALGLPEDKIHELEVPEEDRAHYSKRTIDFEFDFPHGRNELLGLAYRTDFDLRNIERVSGKKMEYRPKDGGQPFVPHVIEPSFGVERAVMAVLTAAYTEDEINGEKRTVLKLPKHLAPVKACVSPLLKNKPELVAKAREVYQMLQKELGAVMWDDNGNIGKRYRRQDEIGTPYCITIDFQTLEDNTVTVRDRDTAEQQRVDLDEVLQVIS